MKQTLLLTFALLSSTIYAQQTTNIWDFDGSTRKYIQYVPQSYETTDTVPLLLVLHGLGDNMNNFSNVGFHQVADTANIIVITPEALVEPTFTQSTAWNSGAGLLGFSLNPDIDDIGFLNAIMDTVSAHYNIDEDRIFVTGFSMGGFMSNRLACELSDRVDAIASVAGTIGSTLTCEPANAIPICHIHGPEDETVGYGIDGGGVADNSYGNNADSLINFWNTSNGCGAITLEGAFPNVDGDALEVEYVEYAGCTENSRVVHYKVNGAVHEWYYQNEDIRYTPEIWKFFLGLSPDNLVPASVNELAEDKLIRIYPNPTNSELNIENVKGQIDRVDLFDATGRHIQMLTNRFDKLDVSEYESGIYLVNIHVENRIISRSFIVE